jgi:hypothetical protein
VFAKGIESTRDRKGHHSDGSFGDNWSTVRRSLVGWKLGSRIGLDRRLLRRRGRHPRPQRVSPDYSNHLTDVPCPLPGGLNLLLTNHAYDDLGLRMFGVLLFSLGIIASGMIVNKASRVYTVTLFVRGFIIAALFVLYSQYGDPALLAINLVVIVGWALTFLSWRKDKAEERR